MEWERPLPLTDVRSPAGAYVGLEPGVVWCYPRTNILHRVELVREIIHVDRVQRQPYPPAVLVPGV